MLWFHQCMHHSVAIWLKATDSPAPPPLLGAGQSFALGHSRVEPFGSARGWLRALACFASCLLALPVRALGPDGILVDVACHGLRG